MTPARSSTRHTTAWLWLMTAVLLAGAAARVLRLDTFQVHHDEVWSVFQTLGTPAQIIQWTPYDWAPLYYLLLGGWRMLVGSDPIVLRFLSAALAVLTLAVIYRISLHISGRAAGGALAVLLYAMLGYSTYQSVVLRGYSLLILLAALTFWWMLRYFHRPTIRRGVLLGVLLAAMLYTHFSAVFAFAAFGLYTAVTMPRRLLLWAGPVALLFMLNLPQLPRQVRFLTTQSNFSVRPEPLPLLENVSGLFTRFVGDGWPVALLALAAAGILAFRYRSAGRAGIALVLWFLLPVAAYATPFTRIFTDPVDGSFLLRYVWWAALPFAVWIGCKLASGPRLMQMGSAAALAGCLLIAPPADYDETSPPFMTYFPQVGAVMRAGDAILVDESVGIRHPYQWQYFTELYLPQGVEYIDTADSHRRIWYISADGWQDADTYAALTASHVPGVFFGPWNFLIRLYEAPPDPPGIRFANGMRFHGAEIIGAPDRAVASYHEGDAIQLRLWWSVDEPPAADYSVGVYLFGADGNMRLENNSGPMVTDGGSETSRWQPGRYYVETRDLTLPMNIHAQQMELRMSVYQWWDGERIAAEALDANGLLLLTRLHLMSWWMG